MDTKHSSELNKYSKIMPGLRPNSPKECLKILLCDKIVCEGAFAPFGMMCEDDEKSSLNVGTSDSIVYEEKDCPAHFVESQLLQVSPILRHSASKILGVSVKRL